MLEIDVKSEEMDSCIAKLGAEENKSRADKEAPLQDTLDKTSLEFQKARDEVLVNQAKLAVLGRRIKEPKNVKQKLGRREHKIEGLDAWRRTLRDRLSFCEEQLKKFETNIADMTKERRSLMLQTNYLKRKLQANDNTESDKEEMVGDNLHKLEQKVESFNHFRLLHQQAGSFR